MVKLKTLKELDSEGEDMFTGYVLRKEAIKEIKEMEEHPTQKLCNKFGVNTDFHEQEFEIIIRYIKWKFNITEEDLNG